MTVFVILNTVGRPTSTICHRLVNMAVKGEMDVATCASLLLRRPVNLIGCCSSSRIIGFESNRKIRYPITQMICRVSQRCHGNASWNKLNFKQ